MTFPDAARKPAAPPSVLRVRVALTITVVLALAPGTAAFAIDRIAPHGTLAARSAAGAGGPGRAHLASDGRADGPAAGVVPTPSTSARPGGTGARTPDGAHVQLVQSQVGQALDRQAAAVRAGDQQAFLAPAATADTGLRATLSRRFAALRALQVAKWEEAVAGTPTPAPGGSWTVPVRLRYCFATPDCLPIPATVQTTWIESGGALTMTAFGTVATADLGPRPWEVSDLRVAAGKRVVLATTQRYAAKLPSMLAAAERAATAADRYARWGAKPARYFVFLAGPTEWGNWYGIPEAGWAAGYAVPITDRYSEIVLNGGRVESNEVGDVLRHEFTHVVTLVGVHRTYPGAWWMMEGLAEYVRAGPVAVGEYSGLAEGRRYVRSGRWDGDVTVDEPGADASTADANGRYAVAYLAVRRLAERFGENRMLDFFAAVVRDGATVEQASVSVLGAQWPDVAADATRSVRRAVA